MILTLLTPGCDRPGYATKIYVSPLIEELKELWEVGVKTYDVLLALIFNCMQLCYGRPMISLMKPLNMVGLQSLTQSMKFYIK